MSEYSANQLFATDQEIFDLIMSSPKRMSESTLMELLADRGIFYSPLTSRNDLAAALASLIHDHHDLAGLVQKGEHGRRNERTTVIILDDELTPSEIKAAVQSYQEDAHHSESMAVLTSTQTVVRVKLDYDEIDYGRTRLIQRQRRQADFDIRLIDGKTRIRLPATAKARTAAAKIKDYIEQKRKAEISVEEVSVASLDSPSLRNDFFTSLIRSIPDCRFQTVTDAKVARWSKSQASEEDLSEARREIINQIDSVSMRGKNIVQTEQYQQFLKEGFFLTSITWRSVFLKEPNDLLQFETSFEDGHAGTGFRYAVRQSPIKEKNGPISFSVVDNSRKPSLFLSIEETARRILNELHQKSVPNPSE